jgi:LPXTG-motif cell wall-anchored protein
MQTTKLTALFLSLALAAPGAALAQSAGDDQYVDPFRENPSGQGGGGGGGGGGGNNGGSQGAQGGSQGAQNGSQDTGTGSGTAGATGSGTAAGTAAQGEPGANGAEGSGSGSLPRTGMPAALLALVGAAMLAGGATLRRRA